MAGRSRAAWIGLALLAVTVAGAASAFHATRPEAHNFSQYPGFADYFAQHPPAATLPDARDRALLERHRPRFHLPHGHAGLIGFYEDYVSQGTLYDGEGRAISSEVDQALLNAHRHDPEVVFVHEPDAARGASPVVFARIDRASLDHRGVARKFTFLTYHTVFRHSGLAAGLTWWQSLAAGLFGDPDDWHQLDHYTAATLVLDAGGAPVALMLQQHNYRHTYLLGETYRLPEDGRPEVDVAIRSNELYPHVAGRREYRAVRFPDAQQMRYLLGAGDGDWLAVRDMTEPAHEADYTLAFLAPDDAFYTFQGFLGERRRLPGRDSPPGADYNTLPHLKPLALQLPFAYWRANHEGDINRLEQALATSDWAPRFAALQHEVFFDNLICLRRNREGCSLK